MKSGMWIYNNFYLLKDLDKICEKFGWIKRVYFDHMIDGTSYHMGFQIDANEFDFNKCLEKAQMDVFNEENIMNFSYNEFLNFTTLVTKEIVSELGKVYLTGTNNITSTRKLLSHERNKLVHVFSCRYPILSKKYDFLSKEAYNSNDIGRKIHKTTFKINFEFSSDIYYNIL